MRLEEHFVPVLCPIHTLLYLRKIRFGPKCLNISVILIILEIISNFSFFDKNKRASNKKLQYSYFDICLACKWN